MTGSRTRVLFVLATTATVMASLRSVAVADEAIDDPKVARRLKTRVDWPLAPTPSSAMPAPGPATTAPTPKPSPVVTSSPPSPSSPAGRLAPRAGSLEAQASSDSTSAPASTAGVVERTAVPPAAEPAFSAPRVQLAFRRFEFVQIGASGSTPGIAASEPFNSLSLDVYPLSSLVRLGLSTQYGWQAGTWASNGDYFAAESLSAGVQLRGGRIAPFAEGFAGLGYMRRLQFDRTIPTVYWQLGADLGANVFLARNGFVSVAVGYLRAVNGFLEAQQFTSAFLDTWSFKIGVGL